jgi:hypothetical protein
MKQLEIEQKEDLAWAIATLLRGHCQDDAPEVACSMLDTLTRHGASNEIRELAADALAGHLAKA